MENKIRTTTARLDRLHWDKKPEIESWKFRYDPTWMEDDKLGNLWHLLWNYEETDAGLRERITSQFSETEKESSAVQGKLYKMTMNDEPFECGVASRQQDGELIPDHLAVFDPENVSLEIGGHKLTGFSEGSEFKCDYRPAWLKLKMTIRKELEPIILPCLDFMVRVIEEIKEAFPFFWCKRINGIVHTPWEMANRILKVEMTFILPGQIRNIPCNIDFTFAEDQEPPSLKPYYIALAILVGLLILHGLACEFGLVNYSPILK